MATNSASPDHLNAIAGTEASPVPTNSSPTTRSLRLQDAEEFVEFIGRLSSSLVSRSPSTPTTPVSPGPKSSTSKLAAQWTPYTPPPSSSANHTSRSHKHSSLNGPDHIPRPENEWMIFRREFNERLRAANTPGHAADVSKVAGAIWRGMSEDEKRPYRIQAAEGRVLHATMYPGYKYRPKPPRAKARRQKRGPPAIEIPSPFAELVVGDLLPGAAADEGGDGASASQDPHQDAAELDEGPDDEDTRYEQVSSEPSSPQGGTFPGSASFALSLSRVTRPYDSTSTISSPDGSPYCSIFPRRDPHSTREELGPRWPWKTVDYSEGSPSLPYRRRKTKPLYST